MIRCIVSSNMQIVSSHIPIQCIISSHIPMHCIVSSHALYSVSGWRTPSSIQAPSTSVSSGGRAKCTLPSASFVLSSSEDFLTIFVNIPLLDISHPLPLSLFNLKACFICGQILIRVEMSSQLPFEWVQKCTICCVQKIF